MIQLDLFHEFNEVDILREEIRQVKESSDKVRKGIFARHGQLFKLYMELSDKLEKKNLTRESL